MYYGQFDPPVDRILHERYFKDKANGVFIECGAFDGTLDSCCRFFEESKGWTGINIEPVPHLFDMLTKNRPKSTNLKVALSNNNGVATFTQALRPDMGNYFGNGSLRHSKDHMKELLNTGCTFEKYQVQTITYKTMVETHKFTSLDLFVLDVEGHELEVIDGMEGSTVWPSVFCIEYPICGLDNLRRKLEPKRYRLDHTQFNNAFFVLS